MTIDISLIEGQTKIDNKLIKALAQHLPPKLLQKRVSVGLHLVDSRKIKKLNQKFRCQNQVTDILSFPLNYNLQPPIQQISEPLDIGDIYICQSEARKQQHSLEMLLVHGFLHLLGLNHQNQKQSLFWQKMAKQIIKQIKQ